jgi:NAD(P)-dependent dehydrogenase (short-subunit alcohol dehydrogenase family)
MNLQNTVALVTGGASGLGEATVRRLVAGGAKVIIADLNTEKGEALAYELEEQLKTLRRSIAQLNALELKRPSLFSLKAVKNYSKKAKHHCEMLFRLSQ